MGFRKFTQAEKVQPVTPAENLAANTEKARTGSVTLTDLGRGNCAQPGACLAPNCGCN